MVLERQRQTEDELGVVVLAPEELHVFVVDAAAGEERQVRSWTGEDPQAIFQAGEVLKRRVFAVLFLGGGVEPPSQVVAVLVVQSPNLELAGVVASDPVMALARVVLEVQADFRSVSERTQL